MLITDAILSLVTEAAVSLPPSSLLFPSSFPRLNLPRYPSPIYLPRTKIRNCSPAKGFDARWWSREFKSLQVTRESGEEGKEGEGGGVEWVDS